MNFIYNKQVIFNMFSADYVTQRRASVPRGWRHGPRSSFYLDLSPAIHIWLPHFCIELLKMCWHPWLIIRFFLKLFLSVLVSPTYYRKLSCTKNMRNGFVGPVTILTATKRRQDCIKSFWHVLLQMIQN